MNFPAVWEIFPVENFGTATPRNPGVLGMELCAQVRPNGRILDHFRVTLGGSRILDVNFPMASLLLVPKAADWRFRFQIWARDIDIRRNMTTSAWYDTKEMLAAREATVVDAGNEIIPQETVLEALDTSGKMAAFRYAVVIGEDQRMKLAVIGLPAAADTLRGKPLHRG